MSHSLRQARNKRWRDKFPAHEYQKKYRENHPDYEPDPDPSGREVVESDIYSNKNQKMKTK